MLVLLQDVSNIIPCEELGVLNQPPLQGRVKVLGRFYLLEQQKDIVGPMLPGDQSLGLGSVELGDGLLWGKIHRANILLLGGL